MKGNFPEINVSNPFFLSIELNFLLRFYSFIHVHACLVS